MVKAPSYQILFLPAVPQQRGQVEYLLHVPAMLVPWIFPYILNDLMCGLPFGQWQALVYLLRLSLRVSYNL